MTSELRVTFLSELLVLNALVLKCFFPEIGQFPRKQHNFAAWLKIQPSAKNMVLEA